MTQDTTAIKFVVFATLIIMSAILALVIIVIGTQVIDFNTMDVNTIIGAPTESIP